MFDIILALLVGIVVGIFITAISLGKEIDELREAIDKLENGGNGND